MKKQEVNRIMNRSDRRVRIALSAALLAAYRVAGEQSRGIDLYYGAYLTGHNDLTDYDVQHHRVGIEAKKAVGSFDLRFDLGGEYTLVGGHAYRNAIELAPAVQMAALDPIPSFRAGSPVP